MSVNAILQDKGAKTGIITNKGFRDIFEIGRGDVRAESMYDFNYKKPPPLVKRRNVVGIDCRVDYKADIIVDLNEAELNDC